jgi:hypothetical protein
MLSYSPHSWVYSSGRGRRWSPMLVRTENIRNCQRWREPSVLSSYSGDESFVCYLTSKGDKLETKMPNMHKQPTWELKIWFHMHY